MPGSQKLTPPSSARAAVEGRRASKASSGIDPRRRIIIEALPVPDRPNCNGGHRTIKSDEIGAILAGCPACHLSTSLLQISRNHVAVPRASIGLLAMGARSLRGPAQVVPFGTPNQSSACHEFGLHPTHEANQ